MRKAVLDEAQAGIKIVGRNINNLTYADDSTLMVECHKEWKTLLMKVRKLSIKKKMKIMASGHISSWEIDGETLETVRDYFLGFPNHCRW